MIRRLGWIAVPFLIAACSEEPGTQTAAAPALAPSTARRNVDPAQLARGDQLYKQHCAACHGARAEGASNWRQRDAQGKFPPPPLDGTGHAWHHPTQVLRDTIKNGTVRQGGAMPAWGGTLSDQDISAVIVWIQSTWPDEVYRAWLEIEQRGSHH